MARTNKRTRKSVIDSIPMNGHCAEIGVFRGHFSALILRERTPQKLYLIDPWINFEDPLYEKTWYHKDSEFDMNAIHDKVCNRFKSETQTGQVEILRGTAQDVGHHIPDGSLDFVYVDGDHSYGGVSFDLGLAFRKAKDTAIIAIDDYYVGGWWNDGVVRATSEFLGRHADRLMILECIESQIIIQKRPAMAMAA